MIAAFEREYDDVDWFVGGTSYRTVVEPQTTTSGQEWDNAMVEARKNISKHPIGVSCLQLNKTRDSEGLMMAYLKFDNAAHFRQWLALDGTFLFSGPAVRGVQGPRPGAGFLQA
jgi:hypothetical protein